MYFKCITLEETNKEMKTFKTKDAAQSYMTMKNRAFEKAGNKKDVMCLVPGPDDDFAVVDLMVGIELGLGYEISY